MMTDLLIELTNSREQMYRFLGGLYIMEVDAQQLQQMKKMEFDEASVAGNAEMADGYRLLKQYIAAASADTLEDLAADYAKVFLAAGDATGRAAFPYESVYVDKRHQINGSAQMQMHALYLARGREPDPNVYRTMEDNIGLMLEYMGILCEELSGLLAAGDMQKAHDLLDEQKNFVKKHLANWVPSFTADAAKYAERNFYKGVAKLTAGFIRQEQEFLNKVGAVWDIG